MTSGILRLTVYIHTAVQDLEMIYVCWIFFFWMFVPQNWCGDFFEILITLFAAEN